MEEGGRCPGRASGAPGAAALCAGGCGGAAAPHWPLPGHPPSGKTDHRRILASTQSESRGRRWTAVVHIQWCMGRGYLAAGCLTDNPAMQTPPKKTQSAFWILGSVMAQGMFILEGVLFGSPLPLPQYDLGREGVHYMEHLVRCGM
eukprot:EG_transcript_10878